MILVGQSYGGTIITVAGADPKVRAPVFVAALQLDIGETTSQLAASMPGEVRSNELKPTMDGFIFIDPIKFAADIATDLPLAQAGYMSNAQTPVAAAAFDAPVTVAAWHGKPSCGIVATADRALNPMLARWMYERSGAKITEIKANHLVYISQPGAVASVIDRAARSIGQNTTNRSMTRAHRTTISTPLLTRWQRKCASLKRMTYDETLPISPIVARARHRRPEEPSCSRLRAQTDRSRSR